MIKATFCLRRLPHLTREEFDRYWYEHHAELVRNYAKELRICRYVQVPVLNAPVLQEGLRASRGAELGVYDGVAEAWWESLEQLKAAFRTPEGAAAFRILLEDEKHFIDLARSRLWYGFEREIVSLKEQNRHSQ